MSPSESPYVQVLQKLAKAIAAIAGAIVGVGALAFSAGFLAQRAQYDFVQVPFVFIDYWAYAETGLVAAVRSINLFVGHPLCLITLVLGTIAIVLALESERFRRAVLRPHWTFLGYVVLLLWFGMILRQQVAVRELRTLPALDQQEISRVIGAETRTSVPAVLPFRWLIPPPLEPPSAGDIQLPASSFEMWSRMADDLAAAATEGALYLEVRPNPSWAVVSANGDSEEDDLGILGLTVDPSRLDSQRAEELFRILLAAFVVGVWAFLILAASQRRIRTVIASDSSSTPTEADSSFSRLLFRLREELWFCSRWVLQGAALLMLVATGIFLMPECYGLLALPRLGQESVEVVSGTREETDAEVDSPPKQSNLTCPAEDCVELEIRRAQRTLSRFSQGVRSDSRKEWLAQVDRMESNGSREAAAVLEMMRNASGAISAELSDVAGEALARVESVTLGFILYYPRSETDYLRVLQENRVSRSKRWTIYPVKTEGIREIQVRRDERTIRLIEILRRMPELDPQERQEALIQVERLGHDRLLEVALGGTFDPSHIIRGFSITDVGRFAAGLPETEPSEFRSRLAARRLLEILWDPQQRGDHRGAAATALHLFIRPGDAVVCDRLVDFLEGDTEQIADPAWQIRGSVITAIGRLRCRKATPRLLALLDESEAPVHVRGSIPSNLSRVATQEEAAAKLKELVVDVKTPVEISGTALTALSLLEGDSTLAVEALEQFLKLEEYPEALEESGRVSDYRRTAISSLLQLGNPAAINTLHWLARRENEGDHRVRAGAILAIGVLEQPESEVLLLEVAADGEERETVRQQAIDALEHYHDNATVLRLVGLYPNVPEKLQDEILETLATRGRLGSSFARAEYARLSQERKVQMVREAAAAPEASSHLKPTLAPGISAPAAPPILTAGSEMRGRLDEGDLKLPTGSFGEIVTLRAAQGQVLTVDLLSDDFDAVLLVGGPGVEAGDDDSGGRCNARVTFTAPQEGEYQAMVTSLSGLGDFELRISEDPSPPVAGDCEIR